MLKSVSRERERYLELLYQDKPGVYFLRIFGDTNVNVIKFGSSWNVTSRLKAHKSEFGKDVIFLDNVIETYNYVKFESVVRTRSNSTFTNSKSKKTHTEIITCETQDELDHLYSELFEISKLCEPFDLLKEKTRHLELTLLIEQTRNEFEKCEPISDSDSVSDNDSDNDNDSESVSDSVSDSDNDVPMVKPRFGR